jgi:hypothetical protein
MTMGFDMMLKSMLGIDPDEMKQQINNFVLMIDQTIKRMEARQIVIETALHQMVATQSAVLLRFDDIEYAIGGRMTVSPRLELEAVSVEQLGIHLPRIAQDG